MVGKKRIEVTVFAASASKKVGKRKFKSRRQHKERQSGKAHTGKKTQVKGVSVSTDEARSSNNTIQ